VVEAAGAVALPSCSSSGAGTCDSVVPPTAAHSPVQGGRAKESEKYRTCVPLYSLKVAAGVFGAAPSGAGGVIELASGGSCGEGCSSPR